MEETKEIRLIADLEEVDTSPPAPELVVRERQVFDEDIIVQERLALESSVDVNLNNTITQGSRLLKHEPQSRISFHVREVSPEENTEELKKEPKGPVPISLHVREVSPEERAEGNRKEPWRPVPISFHPREISPRDTKREPREPVPMSFHVREVSPDERNSVPICFHLREESPEEARGPVHHRLGQRTWSNSSFSSREQAPGSRVLELFKHSTERKFDRVTNA